MAQNGDRMANVKGKDFQYSEINSYALDGKGGILPVCHHDRTTRAQGQTPDKAQWVSGRYCEDCKEYLWVK